MGAFCLCDFAAGLCLEGLLSITREELLTNPVRIFSLWRRRGTSLV